MYVYEYCHLVIVSMLSLSVEGDFWLKRGKCNDHYPTVLLLHVLLCVLISMHIKSKENEFFPCQKERFFF